MMQLDYDEKRLPHLPTIIIETIDHNKQAYETPGNWYYDENGDVHITVSKTNSKYEFLIAVHELIEFTLCQLKGIDEKTVTDFDLRFEDMRKSFPDLIGKKEPGNDDNAPYFHEHAMATKLERWLADSILGDGGNYQEAWDEYANTIDNLQQSINLTPKE